MHAHNAHGSALEISAKCHLMQGPYVLVMVNTGRGSKSKRLPAGWLISTYRSLSRPFRKNVKYIVLVRPSGMLKTILALVRPFVSGKAHRKVCKVRRQPQIISGRHVPTA